MMITEMIEPLKEKEATCMVIAKKSRLGKSIPWRVRYVIDRVCVSVVNPAPTLVAYHV
jgi:hypothetical protein